MGERLDTVVAHATGGIGGQDAGEVAALVEELGRIGQLGRDEGRDRIGRQVRPIGLDAEVRPGDPGGQDPRVVARPVDRPGVGRHAVLLEALGALADGPAKKIPGTLALSHQGVWTGSRLCPTVPTPSAGRSTSGATKPVAEMTSSTSSDRSPPRSVRRRRTVRRPSDARSIRSIDASRTLTPPPRTWSSYGWT